MTKRVKREQLLTKLQQVSHGLASRELLEQSASFVFRDGQVFTFNDEIMCTANYDFGIEGAVHAQQLLNLLGKLPDEEIEVMPDSGNGQVLLSGKNKRAGVRMDAEILLPIDAVEQPSDWHGLHGDFSDGLEVVQGSTSKDDLHFNLQCVHLTSKYVEACDGFQLTRYNLDTGLEKECLVKPESCKAIIGMGFKEVSEGEHWLHFRNDDMRVSCRRWIQDYMDLDEMIDFEGTHTTLPGGLAEAVEKAEIFSVDSAGENLVLISVKEGKLRLKGEGAHGWYEERKKINYQGAPLSFMIPPKLLTEITRRTNDCQITKERLKIDAGKFVFVACLGTAE